MLWPCPRMTAAHWSKVSVSLSATVAPTRRWRLWRVCRTWRATTPRVPTRPSPSRPSDAAALVAPSPCNRLRPTPSRSPRPRHPPTAPPRPPRPRTRRRPPAPRVWGWRRGVTRARMGIIWRRPARRRTPDVPPVVPRPCAPRPHTTTTTPPPSPSPTSSTTPTSTPPPPPPRCLPAAAPAPSSPSLSPWAADRPPLLGGLPAPEAPAFSTGPKVGQLHCRHQHHALFTLHIRNRKYPIAHSFSARVLFFVRFLFSCFLSCFLCSLASLTVHPPVPFLSVLFSSDFIFFRGGADWAWKAEFFFSDGGAPDVCIQPRRAGPETFNRFALSSCGLSPLLYSPLLFSSLCSLRSLHVSSFLFTWDLSSTSLSCLGDFSFLPLHCPLSVATLSLLSISLRTQLLWCVCLWCAVLCLWCGVVWCGVVCCGVCACGVLCAVLWCAVRASALGVRLCSRVVS